MRSFRMRRMVVGLAAMGLGALASTPWTAGAAAGAPHAIVPSHLRVLFDVGVKHTVTRAEAARAAAATGALKTFTATVTDPSTKAAYSYSMVGKNPAHMSTTPSTAVKTLLIPVVVTYGPGYTWNAGGKDTCDTQTPLARVQKSPIFVSQPWTFGGTAVGSGEYLDAFQRANFWKDAQPSGINPSYGVSMTLKTLPKITITVPAGDDYYFNDGTCGNKKVADVNINWLNGYLQSTVIPSLASAGVAPNTFPVFLLHNVAGYTSNNPSDCCVLGFHDAFTTSGGGIQTYAVADYDNSGYFAGFSDVEALSHETAEWTDDPFGDNPTAPWGHVGQVSGCQSNLEVGDPLSGTTIPVTSGGFTYHVQELAFFSWFYHQTPSIAVNGWYSDNNSFTAPAAACS
jgi:hypothetical protein